MKSGRGMSMRISKAALVLTALAMAMLVHLDCQRGVLYAPPGAVIADVTASPGNISTTGQSLITAFALKGTGIPVDNGTDISFFLCTTAPGGPVASLNPPIAKTTDGVAHTFLVADGLSGTVTVQA